MAKISFVYCFLVAWCLLLGVLAVFRGKCVTFIYVVSVYVLLLVIVLYMVLF